MNLNPSYKLATPSLSSYKTLLSLFQRWLQKSPSHQHQLVCSRPPTSSSTACTSAAVQSLHDRFWRLFFMLLLPASDFSSLAWQNECSLCTGCPAACQTGPHLKTGQKKQNKNSLKVHRMGRAKFKPHQSLCDVWVIWCILAHHLKASSFSLVFGRRGSEIFGDVHRQ